MANQQWQSGKRAIISGGGHCVGDAVHPVSPYAGYGMGMAIEGGYYLARAPDGVDLRESAEVTASFSI
ncbi:hypothetical protein KCU64_g2482, partial [Aureobasidium melanogenum]